MGRADVMSNNPKDSILDGLVMIWIWNNFHNCISSKEILRQMWDINFCNVIL